MKINDNLVNSNGTILWTNPNFSGAFASQTITLSDNISNYTYYEIIYGSTDFTNCVISTGKIPVNKLCYLSCGFLSFINRREVSSLSVTSMKFETNEYAATYLGNFSKNSSTNAHNTPYIVIGYK